MGGHPRVLLIDDEKEFTETLAERLEIRGMTVETAANGQTALEMVTAHEYDAVLLDLAMPGWDGIETLKHLKEARPSIQVIILTGRATVHKGIEAMKAGAMDLVEKPAKFQELIQIIEEATKRTVLLLEEQLEHDIEDIIRKRGW
jgi:DNA-binding NtrC family response regulator